MEGLREKTKHMSKEHLEDVLEFFVEANKKTLESHSQQLGTIYSSVNGYGKVYKFLKKDIGFVMALITFLLSVLSPYFLIKNDISLINLNINNMKEDILEVKESVSVIHNIDNRLSNVEGQLKPKSLK